MPVFRRCHLQTHKLTARYNCSAIQLIINSKRQYWIGNKTKQKFGFDLSQQKIYYYEIISEWYECNALSLNDTQFDMLLVLLQLRR